ncbi:hypothetical protein ADIS_0639 [Lunatimonas lonarensis]|uniref:Uncharacterized protein n=2 Tax=Lunatimonas lonarensis TaxID=1232681 RepID=R7ZXE4_9BACT|nr:hypothetical protein ADIS_0639 [Lunatimonas lonarensis]
MDYAASEGKVIKKSIDSFKILFHKKEIHLEKIELVENLQYKNKSYVYTWHFIKSDS